MKTNILLDLKSKLSIAIDGEAGSGKGTFCLKFAEKYNLYYCQSSLFYRKLAYLIIENNISKDYLLSNLDILDKLNQIEDNLLYTESIAQAASKIASDNDIRQILLKPQKDIISKHDRIIMEGRDIATVIMPDADIKLYFTATLQERSYRRYLEYKSSGKNLTLDEITKSILERDERDKNRKDAPLSIAKDALIIDSTGIDAQKLFHLVEKIIIEKSYRGI